MVFTDLLQPTLLKCGFFPLGFLLLVHGFGIEQEETEITEK